MTKEKKEQLIRHLKYNLEIGADYLITDEDAVEIIKALEQESITWIVGKDNCQVAVRNMPIDKVKKICAIIGEEEQQPKTGHWIDIGATHSQCDKCLAVFEIVSANGEANYCPNCGAKMEVIHNV